MRRVIWSDGALQDFDSTLFYLAQESERAATVVADRIEAAIDLLAEMPTGHPGRVKGTYEKYVRKTSYILAYAVSDRAITILRIVHASRDWPDDAWPDDD
ncbi:MAG TPA: type II toxin-antitoxin system RelE/ParE family toxin [Mesorhizobium sp.]|jgi:toxin ParE1/3/4